MTVVRVLRILLVLAPVADRRMRKEYWSDCKCSVRKPSVWHASRRCHVRPYQIATRNVRCLFEPYLHLTNVRLANHSTNTRVVSPLQVNHTDVLCCLTTVSMTNISSPLNREYFFIFRHVLKLMQVKIETLKEIEEKEDSFFCNCCFDE